MCAHSVVFGWMSAAALLYPQAYPLFGLSIPGWLVPFLSLALIQLLVPNASFEGHLSGIAVGFAVGANLFTWFDDYLLLCGTIWSPRTHTHTRATQLGYTAYEAAIRAHHRRRHCRRRRRRAVQDRNTQRNIDLVAAALYLCSSLVACCLCSALCLFLLCRTLIIFVATLKLSRTLELRFIQLIDPNDLEGQRDIAVVNGAIVYNNAPPAAADEQDAI